MTNFLKNRWKVVFKTAYAPAADIIALKLSEFNISFLIVHNDQLLGETITDLIQNSENNQNVVNNIDLQKSNYDFATNDCKTTQEMLFEVMVADEDYEQSMEIIKSLTP